MAIVAYEITLADEASAAYRTLSAYRRAMVREMIDICLTHEPTLESKSRIKRLRGETRAEYRLRVGAIRVYYSVEVDRVVILGIIDKRYSDAWLREGE